MSRRVLRIDDDNSELTEETDADDAATEPDNDDMSDDIEIVSATSSTNPPYILHEEFDDGQAIPLNPSQPNLSAERLRLTSVTAPIGAFRTLGDMTSRGLSRDAIIADVVRRGVDPLLQQREALHAVLASALVRISRDILRDQKIANFRDTLRQFCALQRVRYDAVARLTNAVQRLGVYVPPGSALAEVLNFDPKVEDELQVNAADLHGEFGDMFPLLVRVASEDADMPYLRGE